MSGIAYGELSDAELEARFLEAEQHALHAAELSATTAAFSARWMAIAAGCRDELARRAAAGELRPSFAIAGSITHGYGSPLDALAWDLVDESWRVVREAEQLRVSHRAWFLLVGDRGEVRGGASGAPDPVREDLVRLVDKLPAFEVRLVLDTDALGVRKREIKHHARRRRSR